MDVVLATVLLIVTLVGGYYARESGFLVVAVLGMLVLLLVFLYRRHYKQQKQSNKNFEIFKNKFFDEQSALNVRNVDLLKNFDINESVYKILFYKELDKHSYPGKALIFQYRGAKNNIGECFALFIDLPNYYPHIYILGALSDYDTYLGDDRRELFEVHDVKTGKDAIRIVVEKGADLEAYQILEKNEYIGELAGIITETEIDIEIKGKQCVIWYYFGDRRYLDLINAENIIKAKDILKNYLFPKLDKIKKDIGYIEQAYN
ncbi:hypothetical protein HYS99_01330 [Candidatus Giovannonibacteria bacterium]|nr:hypothetical protein [Candidatus Giovannonibacteria bacterium]